MASSAEHVPLAIVGCGGMGRRHLRGFQALQRSDYNNCELIAVCDINRKNADDLADEAQELLGYRPRVWADLPEMLRREDALKGVNITTEVSSHHTVAVACLEAGRDVQVEKPLGLTMRACNRIIDTAQRNGRLVSVGENLRRDPINRLARSLIDAGAIGTPQLIIDTKIGGGDHMVYTPWRHQKLSGTIALDEGIHHADLMMYYLGEPLSGFGEGRIYQPLRYRRPGGPARSLHAKWNEQYPAQFEATGEDAVLGQLRFANGAVGQWIGHHGAHGQPYHKRILYGSGGSLESQGERNGRPLTLWRAGAEAISDERILDFAPHYRLSPLAAQFFGGERVWSYDLPFDEADWRLIALEHHEFASCIATRTAPEVTGELGRRALAIVYCLFESGMLGRPVSIAEVEQMKVDRYQQEIDAHLALA
jgi:predicted dehydrogenase